MCLAVYPSVGPFPFADTNRIRPGTSSQVGHFCHERVRLDSVRLGLDYRAHLVDLAARNDSDERECGTERRRKHPW